MSRRNEDQVGQLKVSYTKVPKIVSGILYLKTVLVEITVTTRVPFSSQE